MNNNDMKNFEQFTKEGQIVATIASIIDGENVSDEVLNYVIGETIAQTKKEKVSEEKFMNKMATMEGAAT